MTIDITPELGRRFVVGFVGILTLATTGCTGVRQGPQRPWSDAFVQRTPHYTVRTNTAPEVAADIARLMENAAAAYRVLLPENNMVLPRFYVHAYATRKEYAYAMRQLGLNTRVTVGAYSPLPPPTIHLPYLVRGRIQPDTFLLHEGLHQFADHTIRFHVPSNVRETFDPTRQSFLSLPLWLNEGLATYVESAVVYDDHIELGNVNRERLVHLQTLIRRGKCPALQNVIRRAYGETFTAPDYAVAWGIVYSLRHAPVPDQQADRRTRLQHYLAAAKHAFYTDPTVEFTQEFLTNGTPVQNFDRRWAEHIAKRSLQAFERIIVGRENTLADWERDWTTRICQLPPTNQRIR